ELGMASLNVLIITAVSSSVPRERLGYATGLMNLFRNIGGSAGIAMVSTMLARREQFHQQVLVSHLTPLDGGYAGIVQNIADALTLQGNGAPDAGLRAQSYIY